MKKLLLIFLAISFNQISFAHKELVHQHIAIEAYKLLKMRHPNLASSIMETRIETQTGSCSGRTWYTGNITGGAYREDCEDVVYGYSTSNHLFSFEDLKGNNKTQYDLDMGWWIGIKYGVQTNGGPIIERWTVLGSAEYRFVGLLSIPIEYHVWGGKQIIYDGIQYHTYFSTHGSLGIGLKFRVYVKKVNFYFQGSIGTGLGWNPLNLWYATGLEYLLNDKFGIVIDLRKNYYPEFDYFISIGQNISFKYLLKK